MDLPNVDGLSPPPFASFSLAALGGDTPADPPSPAGGLPPPPFAMGGLRLAAQDGTTSNSSPPSDLPLAKPMPNFPKPAKTVEKSKSNFKAWSKPKMDWKQPQKKPKPVVEESEADKRYRGFAALRQERQANRFVAPKPGVSLPQIQGMHPIKVPEKPDQREDPHQRGLPDASADPVRSVRSGYGSITPSPPASAETSPMPTDARRLAEYETSALPATFGVLAILLLALLLLQPLYRRVFRCSHQESRGQ